jgi:fimbrial chaperone protein
MMSTRAHGQPLQLALGTLLAVASTASASGLQVAPTGLEFASTVGAQALWLTNTGDAVLRAQVRAFDWTQVDGSDRLEPTQALVASPPMLELAPGERQLVRVIRTGTPAAAGPERAYRLLVDELPESAQQSGVQYVLRYSVPVFVEGAATNATADPVLNWAVRHEEGRLIVEAGNRGSRHAQLAGVDMLPADGAPVALVPGLLGYVLGGSTMRWTVDAPPAVAATRVRIQVDGEPVELPLAPRPVR